MTAICAGGHEDLMADLRDYQLRLKVMAEEVANRERLIRKVRRVLGEQKGGNWVDVCSVKLVIGHYYAVRPTYHGDRPPGTASVAIWTKDGWRDVHGSLPESGHRSLEIFLKEPK